jgi:hypothetical protein
VNANRFAHTALVAALRGKSNVLQTTNGLVVLNLVPLLNAALQNAQGLISGVVGKTVTLPPITSNELPSVACARIAAAIGRPEPPTCGQITLFPAAKLVAARRAVQIFDRAVVGLLIATPLIAALALWVSRRRRRTLLQLAIGGMLGLVVVRRAVKWEQGHLVSTGPPQNEAARSAIVHGLMHGFFTLGDWILAAGLVIVILTLLTGPYQWAATVRRHGSAASRHAGRLVSAATTRPATGDSDETAVTWIRAHYDLVRIGAIVIAVLLLLVLSVNVVGLLIILAVLGVFELWLYQLRPASEEPPPEGSQPPPRQRTA